MATRDFATHICRTDKGVGRFRIWNSIETWGGADGRIVFTHESAAFDDEKGFDEDYNGTWRLIAFPCQT